jgi:predicted nucleic acid-binding protein
LLDRRKRLLSLVDAVSFVAMRKSNIADVFAFDQNFEHEGFSLVS